MLTENGTAQVVRPLRPETRIVGMESVPVVPNP